MLNIWNNEFMNLWNYKYIKINEFMNVWIKRKYQNMVRRNVEVGPTWDFSMGHSRPMLAVTVNMVTKPNIIFYIILLRNSGQPFIIARMFVQGYKYFKTLF